MLKKIPLDKINSTKNALFFLASLQHELLQNVIIPFTMKIIEKTGTVLLPDP